MGNKLEEIYQKIKEALFNDPEVKEKWNDLIHIDSISDFLKSFKLLFWMAKKIVYVVELAQAEYDAIDKSERIDLAAKLLDDIIVFDGWAKIFEPFDGFAFKLIISGAVNALDDKFGSGNWFKNTLASAELDNTGVLSSLLGNIFSSNEDENEDDPNYDGINTAGNGSGEIDEANEPGEADDSTSQENNNSGT